MGKPALPDGVFADIREAYEAHPVECISLPFMWIARRGGVSCPSDLWDCTDCGVTFYYEGLIWLNWRQEDEDEIRVCACCAKTRGVATTLAQHGVAPVEAPSC